MAKLTRAQRNKLPKSAFCGPNRSFPVTDLKHAAVAKAYLPRAGLSEAVKKSVMQCILRKQEQFKKGK